MWSSEKKEDGSWMTRMKIIDDWPTSDEVMDEKLGTPGKN